MALPPAGDWLTRGSWHPGAHAKVIGGKAPASEDSGQALDPLAHQAARSAA